MTRKNIPEFIPEVTDCDFMAIQSEDFIDFRQRTKSFNIIIETFVMDDGLVFNAERLITYVTRDAQKQ